MLTSRKLHGQCHRTGCNGQDAVSSIAESSGYVLFSHIPTYASPPPPLHTSPFLLLSSFSPFTSSFPPSPFPLPPPPCPSLPLPPPHSPSLVPFPPVFTHKHNRSFISNVPIIARKRPRNASLCTWSELTPSVWSVRHAWMLSK